MKLPNQWYYYILFWCMLPSLDGILGIQYHCEKVYNSVNDYDLFYVFKVENFNETALLNSRFYYETCIVFNKTVCLTFQNITESNCEIKENNVVCYTPHEKLKFHLFRFTATHDNLIFQQTFSYFSKLNKCNCHGFNFNPNLYITTFARLGKIHVKFKPYDDVPSDQIFFFTGEISDYPFHNSSAKENFSSITGDDYYYADIYGRNICHTYTVYIDLHTTNECSNHKMTPTNVSFNLSNVIDVEDLKCSYTYNTIYIEVSPEEDTKFHHKLFFGNISYDFIGNITMNISYSDVVNDLLENTTVAFCAKQCNLCSQKIKPNCSFIRDWITKSASRSDVIETNGILMKSSVPFAVVVAVLICLSVGIQRCNSFKKIAVEKNRNDIQDVIYPTVSEPLYEEIPCSHTYDVLPMTELSDKNPLNT